MSVMPPPVEVHVQKTLTQRLREQDWPEAADRIEELEAKSESVALWLARVTLMDPYPADVFTELTPEEVKVCVAALEASGVRHASDRLHASWARHLYTVAQHIEEKQKEE